MISRASTGTGIRRTSALGAKTLAMAGLAVALLCAAPFDAWAATRNCKPARPRPPLVLKDMGPCAFDAERASFAGEPAQQAACLLRSTRACLHSQQQGRFTSLQSSDSRLKNGGQP
jgi:hypothetical protein